jgi:hypothetical protein
MQWKEMQIGLKYIKASETNNNSDTRKYLIKTIIILTHKEVQEPEYNP